MSTVTAVPALEPLSSGVLAYIAILVVSYLLFLLGVSIWSWNQNRGRTVSVDEHFTAGSSLGPIVLSFTLFATSYSGYTVIGIPNEAYVKGFMSNRWSCMSLCVVTISVVIYSRLREVSMERKYNSPASLIQDRYQSKVLHRAVALIMAIPMQFYVTAQFTAIGSTIVSLSQGNVPALAGQIVLAIIMLLYETFGGLKGVAITDVLQGCLLLVGTIGTCFVLATVYGPFDEAWDRIINTSHTQWKMLPTVAQKVDFFSFMAAQMAFPIYPHVLQRVVAARCSAHLRTYLTRYLACQKAIKSLITLPSC
jgi:SSS family solute:Na+ symporter/sodium/pantothenate symporter